MTNDNEVVVIDDFLDSEYFNQIRDQLLKPTTPWYMHTIDNNFNLPYNIVMKHIVYADMAPASDFHQMFVPIYEKLNIFSLIRVKANLQYPTSEVFETFWHQDIHPGFPREGLRLAILYLNDNDGYTKLENGQIIQAKANRMAIIPGHMQHTGSTHTGSEFRAVINFNYIEGRV